MHDDTPNDTEPSAPVARRSPAMLGLLVVVGLEFLALAVVTVVLVVELLVAPATSIASGIALTVLVAIAALWLGALLNGLWHGRSWVRSGIIVWQVLQLLVGFYAFQGEGAQPAFGVAAIAPAVVVVVLLLTRPVRDAMRLV